MQDAAASNKPLISVCIANYNGIDIIGPCIDSVLNQNTNYPIEILVHDDASTDNSANFIKTNYPHVKFLQSKHNVGYCISNNKLAEHANGEYILLLNNDATLFSDAVQTLIEYAESTGNDRILSLPQYDVSTEKFLDQGNLFDFFLNPVANKNRNRKSVGMVIGACLWVPKSMWNEIGGFPPWFESLAEDMYLCMYAFTLDHEIVALNKSGYMHKVGHSFGGGKIKQYRLVTTYNRRRLSERNKTYVMVLFYPALLFCIIFPFHLFLLLFEGLLLALLKWDYNIFDRIYLNTLINIWKQKSLLCDKRRLIQSKRKIGYGKFLSVFVYYPYKLKMLIAHGVPSLK